MLQGEARATALGESKRSQSYWALSLRRLMRKKLGVTCLAVIVLLYSSGILAPLVAPYGYNDQDLTMAKQGPSLGHPFGTDRLGRDILSRIIYGLRTTVIITVTTLVTGSLALGITLGLMAGYFGRLIDTIIMRVGEVTSAFPEIFLVLIIVATVKPPITEWVRGIEDAVGFDIVRLGIVDYMVIALALSIFSWFGMARLVRGQVLQVRENQYVEAARAVGVSTPRILLRHVFPNVIGPVIVVSSAGLAGIAGSEIFLSWLGIGIQPPTPSLGLMIFENGSISVLRTNPHLLLFPVGTLALLLFTFNLLGDAMNDAFNPRTR
jgi:ABC-type dipeptide/oligopeptide/nickel transport system permease subunit